MTAKFGWAVEAQPNFAANAEKLAALAGVWRQMPWPEVPLHEAWRTLLLAQHHDCWIVPSNRPGSQTWADHVLRWTDATRNARDEIISHSMAALAPESGTNAELFVRVFNTLAQERTGLVSASSPDNWNGSAARI